MAQHLRRNRKEWSQECSGEVGVALGEESAVPPLTGRRNLWAVQTDICRGRRKAGERIQG